MFAWHSSRFASSLEQSAEQHKSWHLEAVTCHRHSIPSAARHRRCTPGGDSPSEMEIC